MVKNISMLAIFFMINLFRCIYPMYLEQQYLHCCEQMVAQRLMWNNNTITNGWYETIWRINLKTLTNPIFTYVIQWRSDLDNLVRINKINPLDFCQAYANTSNNMELANVKLYITCCGQMMAKALMKNSYDIQYEWNQRIFKIDPIKLGNPIFSYVLQWKSGIDNIVKRGQFNPKDYCELYSYTSNNMEIVNEQQYFHCCEQMVAQNLMTEGCNAYTNGWKMIIKKKDDLNGLENPVLSFIKQWKETTPDNFVKRNNCNPKDYCVVYGSASDKLELWDVQLYNHCCEQMVAQNLMTNHKVVDTWNEIVLKIDPNGLENPIFSYVLQWQSSIDTFVKRKHYNPKEYCELYDYTSNKKEIVNEQQYLHCREQMVAQNLMKLTVTENSMIYDEIEDNWKETVLKIDPNCLENPVSSFIQQWQDLYLSFVKRNNCNPKDYCILYGSISDKLELWDDGMQSLGITDAMSSLVIDF
ncbi:uncharacterized protein LOC113558994 isoform X2 [Rhopalosiphum maidis]|uniref:uncharacterized protein LOC113558994 isoform X2 n=1 Tax=Rhopalosiphum maidis TaxID=43146 RepID=UPI000F00F8BF|nr:uncharacterized protein LOC113558994 isoform X2 [Rhopalosiphum maidis]